ncbi:class I SAM-dependent methyltransferase [Candidatus Gottesmanbacteria bacterium]|nr:class I SAM-dependent methyltransferase [Candidatus Gottesmanbacteria bacterium]
MDIYYRKRAEEYEEIYYRDDPIRNEEQRIIVEAIKKAFNGMDVLEIACGTGYWTQFLSETAKSIVATDYVEEVMQIAKRKKYKCPVQFQKEDAYNLSFGNHSFDGILANLWFSHVPKVKIDTFLEGIQRVLKPGGIVFMADNNYVEGSGGELVRKEGEEDTYKRRFLKDGSEYMVLKNYYTLNELFDIFSRYDKGLKKKNIFYGKFFCYVIYRMKDS